MRIILADHHEQALRALRRLIEQHNEFDCLGEAGDAHCLLRLAEDTAPDLILVDRELPGCPMKELIGRLHAFQPRPTIVVMSSECEYSRALLQDGADAFVSKADHPDWLLEKLHKYANPINMDELSGDNQ